MTELSQLDVTTKAAVLLEALPYIQRFRDAVFVVKYGGAFMDDADPAVRTQWQPISPSYLQQGSRSSSCTVAVKPSHAP